MANWLNGGISSKAIEKRIRIETKPNCGIARS